MNKSPLATLVLVAPLLLTGAVGHAHDEHQWVQDKQLRGPSGQLCCGQNDCHLLPAEQLLPVENGWEVYWQGRTEFVLEKDTVKRAPDGRAHICLTGDGLIRCLIVPPPGS